MSARGLLLVLAMGSALGACANDFTCEKDYDCPPTQVCNRSSGVCEDFKCEVNDDCPDPGKVCVNNACVAKDAAPKTVTK